MKIWAIWCSWGGKSWNQLSGRWQLGICLREPSILKTYIVWLPQLESTIQVCGNELCHNPKSFLQDSEKGLQSSLPKLASIHPWSPLLAFPSMVTQLCNTPGGLKQRLQKICGAALHGLNFSVHQHGDVHGRTSRRKVFCRKHIVSNLSFAEQRWVT